MHQSINGRALAKQIHAEAAKRTQQLKNKGITPKLAVILVGEDPASKLYVGKKGKAAQKIGMDFELHEFKKNISQKRLETAIKKIQQNNNISGLIVQLPVPENFYPTVLNAVDPKYDVDCLTHTNLGKLVMKTNTIVPPTPGAVMTILDSLQIPLKGKNIVIIGAGVLVGKPLSIMMMNEEATVIICNAFTNNISKYTKKADIIITGVGKKHILTKKMVGKKQIIIDAGVDFENDHMFGDVDFDAVAPKTAFITPTPGGVGPLTVARLLLNTAICAEEIYKENK
jgi:methylenetetrahydrofolate dehydrogenase (NADP+) / methenyltetrahydrofolate cyclohydrolase